MKSRNTSNVPDMGRNLVPDAQTAVEEGELPIRVLATKFSVFLAVL